MDNNIILAAIGSTEPSKFSEFCYALEKYCPEREDKKAWADLFRTLELLTTEQMVRVERKNGRITELQLTKKGADYIRPILDENRGLLAMLASDSEEPEYGKYD